MRARASDDPVDVGNPRSPRVASGNLADEIARPKQERGKEIVAHGGVRFAETPVSLGLVIEDGSSA